MKLLTLFWLVIVLAVIALSGCRYKGRMPEGMMLSSVMWWMQVYRGKPISRPMMGKIPSREERMPTGTLTQDMQKTLQQFKATNETDASGNTTGGTVKGPGLDIRWQAGAMGKTANGATIEAVILAAKQRIEALQNTSFSCREYVNAIDKLDEALQWLNYKTERRDMQIAGAGGGTARGRT